MRELSNVNTAIYPYSLNKMFLVRIVFAFSFISYNQSGLLLKQVIAIITCFSDFFR